MELNDNEKAAVVSALTAEHIEYGPYDPSDYEEIRAIVSKLGLVIPATSHLGRELKGAGYGQHDDGA